MFCRILRSEPGMIIIEKKSSEEQEERNLMRMVLMFFNILPVPASQVCFILLYIRIISDVTSCSGFGDDEKGFYSVYSEVFNTLAAEDAEFMDESDEEDIPSFGKSDDDYETVVGPFYAYWSVYTTSRSYSWLDKYDTRQGENRWVKRKMEAENKKIRDKKRKERNEAVRNLVGYVRYGMSKYFVIGDDK